MKFPVVINDLQSTSTFYYVYVHYLITLFINFSYLLFFAYEALLQCNLFTYPIPFNKIFSLSFVFPTRRFFFFFFSGGVGGGDGGGAASRSWAVRNFFNKFFDEAVI